MTWVFDPAGNKSRTIEMPSAASVPKLMSVTRMSTAWPSETKYSSSAREAISCTSNPSEKGEAATLSMSAAAHSALSSTMQTV